MQTTAGRETSNTLSLPARSRRRAAIAALTMAAAGAATGAAVAGGAAPLVIAKLATNHNEAGASAPHRCRRADRAALAAS